jgi:hypothetical protein
MFRLCLLIPSAQAQGGTPARRMCAPAKPSRYSPTGLSTPCGLAPAGLLLIANLPVLEVIAQHAIRHQPLHKQSSHSYRPCAHQRPLVPYVYLSASAQVPPSTPQDVHRTKANMYSPTGPCRPCGLAPAGLLLLAAPVGNPARAAEYHAQATIQYNKVHGPHTHPSHSNSARVHSSRYHQSVHARCVGWRLLVCYVLSTSRRFTCPHSMPTGASHNSLAQHTVPSLSQVLRVPCGCWLMRVRCVHGRHDM